MNTAQLTMAGGTWLAPSFHSGSQEFKASLTPQVGDCITLNDGREFRLVSTAVDLVAGQLVAVPSFNVTPIDNLVTAATAVKGSQTVEVDTTGVAMFGGANGVIAAGRLKGATLVINDDTGDGYTYTIKNNTAGTASAKVTLTLNEPLVEALDATSDVLIVSSPFDNVVVSTGALAVVGVACVDSTAATNSRTEYLWVQTKGIAAVKVTTGTSVAVGKPAVADTAGGTKLAGAVTDILVGTYLATDTTAGAFLPVQLKIW